MNLALAALDRARRVGALFGGVLPLRLALVRGPVVALWAAACTFAWVAHGLGIGASRVRLGLFFVTLAAQALALVTALVGRRALAREDPSRAAFTAVAVGFALRLVAELRLSLLYLDAVPGFIRDHETVWGLYFFGLRYLYTAADLALLTGFVRALRGLRSTGLGFRTRRRDLLLALLLVPLPLTVYTLQVVLAHGPVDANIFTFRLVAASVGALVSGVCILLASAAWQMGGGAWAWIWGAAAAAGLARALAFVAAAAGAIVLEQSLLWTFACGWLLATALHWRLVR